MKKAFLFITLIFLNTILMAQLKFVIEDFEGCADGNLDLKKNGIFIFGDVQANVISGMDKNKAYSGSRALKINRTSNAKFGGWGKGLGQNMVLDAEKDYLNFYVYQPSSNPDNLIRIELQEDDNGDNLYKKENDDSWEYQQEIKMQNAWQLISIPLNKFKDATSGGDGNFNVSYKNGKLICVLIDFVDSKNLPDNLSWTFDFLCFSKGKLQTGNEIFDAPPAYASDHCSLGTWSPEGNTADFCDIGLNFEKNFNCPKKLGVAHFFQPFAVDGGVTQNHYPSVERINKVIEEGYIPMITLEDHFVNSKPGFVQPNLYSIIEGHFDQFFADWAKEIKLVNGIVLLRIFHEFNGDWYPWCIVNNDKNPELLIKAYRHIHDIFNEQQVANVKFIWCPNSMSIPQESWNYIMEAYPGDKYVDYVALDVYNGAGKGTTWRSFRKEGIENYFILTQELPDKPLFICETASRERESNEFMPAQNKAEWIDQMSQALMTDMSKVRLLTWFNEKSTFKITSSKEAQKGFQTYIMKNNYFKSGAEDLNKLLLNKED
jgi:hypothetical protein